MPASTAASTNLCSPVARPTSASAEIAMPFQAARTLSSVAGRMRRSRTSNSSARARWMSEASSPGSTSRSAATSSSGTGRQSTFVPSQLPSGIAPSAPATVSPAISTSSAHDQTKNLPSTPSLSASWEEENPPPGCRSSRSRYSQVSTATRRYGSCRVTCHARTYRRASSALS